MRQRLRVCNSEEELARYIDEDNRFVEHSGKWQPDYEEYANILQKIYAHKEDGDEAGKIATGEAGADELQAIARDLTDLSLQNSRTHVV